MEWEQTEQVTVTYKVRLYENHLDWIVLTRDLYNQVLEFYYQLLLNAPDLLALSNYKLLRELEIRTVGTKEMKKQGKTQVSPLLGFPKLPLYFRRAALNHAISMARSYQIRYQHWKEEKIILHPPARTTKFYTNPVFYKGMYRAFCPDSIELKLYNGEKWIWRRFRYTGRSLPREAVKLSPSLHIKKGQAWLHIPLSFAVCDTRKVQERFQMEERFLAVYFPSSNCMAAGVILTKEGKQIGSCYLKGGNELKQRREVLLQRIRKIQQSRKEKGTKAEGRIYQKIENLNLLYAHKISRQLVKFCEEKQIKLIVMPTYQKELDFSKLSYLKSGKFDWQGRKIMRLLKYKALQQGIALTTVKAVHISSVCSECGEKIKKYNPGFVPKLRYFGGSLFVCSCGKRGNSALNAAKNIGLRFLRQLNLDELYYS